MGVLEDLKAEVRKIELAQSLCKHEWNEPVYKPYEKERTTFELVPFGSDPYVKEVGTGSFDKIKRWTRTCKICGKEESTEELCDKVILSRKEPKF